MMWMASKALALGSLLGDPGSSKDAEKPVKSPAYDEKR
jgi:hypothetical protein